MGWSISPPCGRPPEVPRDSPAEWHRQANAGEFIKHIAETLNVDDDHVYQAVPGRYGGTRAYWQVAIAYAKDLSHEFHEAVNEAAVRWYTERNGSAPDLTAITKTCPSISDTVDGIDKVAMSHQAVGVVRDDRPAVQKITSPNAIPPAHRTPPKPLRWTCRIILGGENLDLDPWSFPYYSDVNAKFCIEHETTIVGVLESIYGRFKEYASVRFISDRDIGDSGCHYAIHGIRSTDLDDEDEFLIEMDWYLDESNDREAPSREDRTIMKSDSLRKIFDKVNKLVRAMASPSWSHRKSNPAVSTPNPRARIYRNVKASSRNGGISYPWEKCPYTAPIPSNCSDRPPNASPGLTRRVFSF